MNFFKWYVLLLALLLAMILAACLALDWLIRLLTCARPMY